MSKNSSVSFDVNDVETINLFVLECMAYLEYRSILDNTSLIVLEFHVDLIVMILVEVMMVYSFDHRIDRIFWLTTKREQLHDSQKLDEEITRAWNRNKNNEEQESDMNEWIIEYAWVLFYASNDDCLNKLKKKFHSSSLVFFFYISMDWLDTHLFTQIMTNVHIR